MLVYDPTQSLTARARRRRRRRRRRRGYCHCGRHLYVAY